MSLPPFVAFAASAAVSLGEGDRGLGANPGFKCAILQNPLLGRLEAMQWLVPDMVRRTVMWAVIMVLVWVLGIQFADSTADTRVAGHNRAAHRGLNSAFRCFLADRTSP